MSEAPIFDYTCSHCGTKETFQLVMKGPAEAPPSTERRVPEFDYTCAHCGARDTFQLVPARSREPAS